MTRRGLRQWPKSKKSHRTVPVPPDALEGMSVLTAGRGWNAIVFAAPEGGPVKDGDFRNRVWYPAVGAARLRGKRAPRESDGHRPGTCGPKFCDDSQHGIRRFAPRVMRHTAASWLVQDGVPLYDVQALLGHEDYATTQRYAHLAPDAHSKVLESWARLARRPDASVTHGRKKAVPHVEKRAWVGVAGLNRRPLRPELRVQANNTPGQRHSRTSEPLRRQCSRRLTASDRT
jgi:integrase